MQDKELNDSVGDVNENGAPEASLPKIDYQDLYLRSQAEIQNATRRHDAAITNIRNYAIERFLVDLLPVLDSIDNAIALDNRSQEGAGLVMTRNILLNVFHKFGIVPITVSVGDSFNPEKHEAIKVEKGANGETDTVLYEVQKGYELNHRVVRPARVCVSQA
jgi:molecular chaperone GrpE